LTAFDGSPAEMSILPEDADWPSPDDATAERLLSGHGAWPDAPPDVQALALVLQAAARPAMPLELAGEQAAVAAFERAITRRRPRAWLRVAGRVPVLVSGGTLALAAVLGGTAVADSLPAPLQQVAHNVFDAPAPRPAVTAPSAVARPAPEGSSGDRAGAAAPDRHPRSPGGTAGKPNASGTKAKDHVNRHANAPTPGKVAKAKARAAAMGRGKANAPGKGYHHKWRPFRTGRAHGVRARRA
jgi:hypothetical protein